MEDDVSDMLDHALEGRSNGNGNTNGSQEFVPKELKSSESGEIKTSSSHQSRSRTPEKRRRSRSSSRRRRSRSKSRDRRRSSRDRDRDRGDHRRRHRSRSHSRRRSRSRDRDRRRSPRRRSPRGGRTRSRSPRRRSPWRRSPGPRGRLPGPERRDVMPFRARRSPPPNANMDMTPEERDERTVFIMQLARDTKPRDLEDFFASSGHVRDVRIITDSKTGRSKGIAYVEFWNSEDVSNAITLTGNRLRGAPLIIQNTNAERNRKANNTVGAAIGFGPASTGGPLRLNVDNLHPSITTEMLRDIFEPFGRLERCELESEGFAVVEFRSPEEGKKAMEQMNGFEVAGKSMRVMTVEEETPSTIDMRPPPPKAAPVNSGQIELMAGLGFNISSSMAAAAIPDFATECFMLSNMFSPGSENEPNWDRDVRDDVIDECTQTGGVVHIYVDKKSEEGHVYIKCPTRHAAHFAVSALHGRMFAGKVITANYVPTNSYHELFPESRYATQKMTICNRRSQRLNAECRDQFVEFLLLRGTSPSAIQKTYSAEMFIKLSTISRSYLGTFRRFLGQCCLSDHNDCFQMYRGKKREALCRFGDNVAAALMRLIVPRHLIVYSNFRGNAVDQFVETKPNGLVGLGLLPGVEPSKAVEILQSLHSQLYYLECNPVILERVDVPQMEIFEFAYRPEVDLEPTFRHKFTVLDFLCPSPSLFRNYSFGDDCPTTETVEELKVGSGLDALAFQLELFLALKGKAPNLSGFTMSAKNLGDRMLSTMQTFRKFSEQCAGHMKWLSLKFVDTITLWTHPETDWISKIVSEMNGCKVRHRIFDNRTEQFNITYRDCFLSVEFSLTVRSLFWRKVDIYLGD